MINVAQTDCQAVSNTFENSQVSLEAALRDGNKALELFLSNRFADALELLRPWRSQSMYHAMGYSSILFMQAGLTFDPKDMDKAMTALKESLHTCQMFRKKPSVVQAFTEWFYKQPTNDMTEEEMHAELCYAEVLMQKAALTLLDESVISFIKGGIRIRNSFIIYKECEAMSTMARNQAGQMSTHADFRGGVNMGIGSFNLVRALNGSTKRVYVVEADCGVPCPPPTLQEKGLSQLREGAASNSLRSILSTICLLMYQLYISVILGTGEGNLVESEALLEPYIKKFPKGALIIFYQARIAVLRGNFELAQELFLECIATQQEWHQIHHLCYWELMWTYCFQQNWLEAYKCADLLCKESKWSQAMYVFQKASILSMMPEEEVEKTGENVEQLFMQVESLRLRIAGKSIPTEKFAAKKAQRYSAAEPVKLAIPALEMIYVWNGFTAVGKRPELTQRILVTIEKAEEELKNGQNSSEYHVDDQCVVQMLKGLCLRHLGLLEDAELCFTHVISSESHIKHDLYLVPYSMYELGLVYKQQGDLGKATTTIENAKLNYKDYSMESRLHFRIHASLNSMSASMAKCSNHRTSA
uniref:Tetratricopeptide repeat protein 39B n=1 Tax=Esox lucius TaxID=8010 RepID=A0A6Q2ZCU4_ESOLU